MPSAVAATCTLLLHFLLRWSIVVSETDLPSALPVEEHKTDNAKFYFWNTVTGDVQWDDPGDVAFETTSGVRFWIGKDGERMYQDKEAAQYVWVEGWSEEYERPFFYNQQTKQSTWDRPPDLAWRRLSVPEEL